MRQASIGAELVSLQGGAPGWKPRPVAPPNKRKRGLPLENAVFIEQCRPRSRAVENLKQPTRLLARACVQRWKPPRVSLAKTNVQAQQQS